MVGLNNIVMKSYTDIEQSKVLSKILPIESTDMRYQAYYDSKNNLKYIPKFISTIIPLKVDIPCWSLAALLSIIPQELFGGEYIINITEGVNHKWVISYETFCGVSSYAVNTSGDNLIDCCVEMIIKLKERNLL